MALLFNGINIELPSDQERFVFRGISIEEEKIQSRFVFRGLSIGERVTQQRFSFRGLNIEDRPPIDKGEAWFGLFGAVGTQQEPGDGPPLPENNHVKCCFKVPVFGSLSDDSDLVNDRSGLLFIYSSGVNSAVMKLYKNGVETATLNNNTLGEFYPYAFFETESQKYTGYLINWKDVLSTYGSGCYSVKVEIDGFQGAQVEDWAIEYDLKGYHPILANRTVRIDFYNNNLIGDWQNRGEQKNFADLNWFNQLRFPRSLFGLETSEYEIDEVLFKEGVKYDNKNEQEPVILLEIRGIDSDLHRYLKTEILQAKEIFVTDYNNDNPSGIYIDVPVKNDGSYEPNYNAFNQTPSVVVTFKLAKNQLKQKLC